MLNVAIFMMIRPNFLSVSPFFNGVTSAKPALKRPLGYANC
jgi:hypothetical protein